MVVRVVLPLVVLPVLLELLRYRLGGRRGLARMWWPLALIGCAGWLSSSPVVMALAGGLFLVPSLLLAAVGVSRLLAARREAVDTADRANWILGQCAISLALMGPAIVGWSLVARALGYDVDAGVVARVLVGITATGLLAGELCISSGRRWGLLSAVAALLTALLVAVPGSLWLAGVGVTLVVVGLALRQEIRPDLPGAPGVDGLVALIGGVGTLVLAWPLPQVATVVGLAGLVGTAAGWGRVVQRLNEPSGHSGACSCCADHGAPAEVQIVE